MKIHSLLLAGLTGVCLSVHAAEPQVLIVGTYHFSNPGQDIHNMEAVDVLTDDAQRQIDAITDAIGRFKPTRVFVEWPEDVVDERYAKYLDGNLEPSRNEVVQLGFRLARAHDITRVNGIDVDGDFPFEAVMKWADEHGRGNHLQAMQDQIAARVKAVERIQHDDGIAAVLRHMNRADRLREEQAFYLALLRFGAGDEQPGAALNTAWFDRNMRICARLLQKLADNDRAVVFFGAGHVPWLQRCIEDTPGVTLINALDYLPRESAP